MFSLLEPNVEGKTSETENRLETRARYQPPTNLGSQEQGASLPSRKAAWVTGHNCLSETTCYYIGKWKTLYKSAFRCLVKLRSYKHWVITNKAANTWIIPKGSIQSLCFCTENSSDLGIHGCANWVFWFHVPTKRTKGLSEEHATLEKSQPTSAQGWERL